MKKIILFLGLLFTYMFTFSGCGCTTVSIMHTGLGMGKAYLVEIDALMFTETERIDTTFMIIYDINSDNFGSSLDDCEVEILNPIVDEATVLSLDKPIYFKGDSIASGSNLLDIEGVDLSINIDQVSCIFQNSFIDHLDTQGEEFEFLLEVLTSEEERFTSTAILTLDF